jgi:hypothetical protein
MSGAQDFGGKQRFFCTQPKRIGGLLDLIVLGSLSSTTSPLPTPTLLLIVIPSGEAHMLVSIMNLLYEFIHGLLRQTKGVGAHLVGVDKKKKRKIPARLKRKEGH